MKYAVKEKIHITGRGTLLVIDLKENGVTEYSYIERLPFKKDDIIETNLGEYKVKAVESKRNLLDGKLNSTVGILI